MAEPRKAVQVSVYLDEADQWYRPFHLEMLKYLRENQVAGAKGLHTVACFTGRGRIKTPSLVDAAGKLRFLLTYIETEEHATEVLEHIREMASHRLSVSEKVILESGEIE